MRNLINLYYNTISNKAFEGIRLVREFFTKDGDMSSFRKLHSSNISLQEKVILTSLDEKLKISEEDYVHNGYLASNGDRYIFVDNLDFTSIWCTKFQTVTKQPNGTNFISDISIFFISRNLLKNCDDKRVIYTCYKIAQWYFKISLTDINNSPIAISAYISGSENIFDKRGIYGRDDKIFYVNYLITMIMILDVMFNFKFNDIPLFIESIFTSCPFWLSTEAFKGIFEYAINEQPVDSDYVLIFREIIKENK